MSKPSGVLVKKFANGSEAEMAKETLLAQGVFSLVQHYSAVGNIAGYKTGAPWSGVGEWGLYVKTSDAEKAHELLADIFDDSNKQPKSVDFKKAHKDFMKFVIIFFTLVLGIPALVLLLGK